MCVCVCFHSTTANLQGVTYPIDRALHCRIVICELSCLHFVLTNEMNKSVFACAYSCQKAILCHRIPDGTHQQSLIAHITTLVITCYILRMAMHSPQVVNVCCFLSFPPIDSLFYRAENNCIPTKKLCIHCFSVCNAYICSNQPLNHTICS